MLFMNTANQKSELKYYEIVDLVKNNEVSEFELNLYTGELKYILRKEPKTVQKYTCASADIFYPVNSGKSLEKSGKNKNSGGIYPGKRLLFRSPKTHRPQTVRK